MPRSRSRCRGRSVPGRRRLGRRLRPGAPGPDGERKIARFYTVVSRDTVDAEFAQHRQRFLAEQGYSYRIVDAEDVFRAADDA